MRTKKLLINFIASTILEFIILAYSIIIPRLILQSFGSDYNGIVSSVTQFISSIALLKAGIGSVTRAALYKPLAENNYEKINSIINATNLYLKKITIIFIVILIVFSLTYSLYVKEFSFLFSTLLILIISSNVIFQYFFGMTYQILLQADQKTYIISLSQSLSILLNLIFSILLINAGANILIVKLASSISLILSPLLIHQYVKNAYKLDKKIKPDVYTINHKWDSLPNHLAEFVRNNTDIIILTIFASLKDVSVYVVYYLVINGVTSIIKMFTNNFSSVFGNMLAKNEIKQLEKKFSLYEIIVFSVASLFLVTTYELILPFISIYTAGINDTNYIIPNFALIAILAAYFNVLRIPYQSLVYTIGHFNQTRNGAIIEAILNVLLSVILVINYGIIGVTIGTLFATVFRTIQYSNYYANNIGNRSRIIFLKNFLIFFSYILVSIIIISSYIKDVQISNFSMWLIYSGIVFSINLVLISLFLLIFYKKLFALFALTLRKVFNSIMEVKKHE
jgi:O-antigen/teichoic acid export membrane protein